MSDYGTCDACNKETPDDELAASDYGENGIAYGTFCDTCRFGPDPDLAYDRLKQEGKI